MRMANILGVGDRKISRKKNALQYFIREVVQGRDVSIYDESSLRDFIDVRDAARAVALCVDYGKLDTIYNIGNGIPYLTKDIIYYAHKKSNSKSKIVEVPVPEFHKKVQTSNFWMDISKLQSLGYSPNYGILDTVDELIEHFQRGNEW
jgi:nucleoside-diphosphate-sugar epimerase